MGVNSHPSLSHLCSIKGKVLGCSSKVQSDSAPYNKVGLVGLRGVSASHAPFIFLRKRPVPLLEKCPLEWFAIATPPPLPAVLDCGVHYLWFAFVCFLIRSHPPLFFPPPSQQVHVRVHIPSPDSVVPYGLGLGCNPHTARAR